MKIIMAGIDFHSTKAEIRQKYTHNESEINFFLQNIIRTDGISGCIAVVTCNRTEIYLSVSENIDPVEIIINWKNNSPCASNEDIEYKDIYEYCDEQAVNHIMEVACGIHSQVLHEEQIVTQINQSLQIARANKSADPILDTLFRIAVSAGKYALTNVERSEVPLSLSYEAIKRLEKNTGDLKDKKCVIIGNGHMGQLAADILLKKGCRVYVTLRSYHGGSNAVIKNTFPVPYEERMKYIDGSDIVISATRSPHQTVKYSDLMSLENKPEWLIDLAMPFDIDPKCRNAEDVHFWNIDDFDTSQDDNERLKEKLFEVSEKYAADFEQWLNYRNSIPYINKIKEIIPERISSSTSVKISGDIENADRLITIAAEKTIDMIFGAIRSEIYPEMMKKCFEKIKDRAR